MSPWVASLWFLNLKDTFQFFFWTAWQPLTPLATLHLAFFLPPWLWLLSLLVFLPSASFLFLLLIVQSLFAGQTHFQEPPPLLGPLLCLQRLRCPRQQRASNLHLLFPSGGLHSGIPQVPQTYQDPSEVLLDQWWPCMKHVSSVCQVQALFFGSTPAILAKRRALGIFV